MLVRCAKCDALSYYSPTDNINICKECGWKKESKNRFEAEAERIKELVSTHTAVCSGGWATITDSSLLPDKKDIEYIERMILDEFRIPKADQAQGAYHVGTLLRNKVLRLHRVIMYYNILLDYSGAHTNKNISPDKEEECDPCQWVCPKCNHKYEKGAYYYCEACGHKEPMYYDYRYSTLGSGIDLAVERKNREEERKWVKDDGSKEEEEYKPQKIKSIEKQCGGDILTILKRSTGAYANMKDQCAALDISISYLYYIIDKYAKLPFLEFMAIYSTGRRREQYILKMEEKHKERAKDNV